MMGIFFVGCANAQRYTNRMIILNELGFLIRDWYIPDILISINLSPND
jgi:hypothetical protein